ncbi:MAG: hypothetical protein ACMUJM_24490 [bacterium]
MNYKSCMRLVTILICSFTFCIICIVHKTTAQVLEDYAVMNGEESQINLDNDTEDVSQSDEDPRPSRSVGEIWNMPSPYLTTIPDAGSNANIPVENYSMSQLHQDVTGIVYDISSLSNPLASIRSSYTTTNSGRSYINDYSSYPFGAPIGYEGYKVGPNSYVTDYADYAKIMLGYKSYPANYSIGYNSNSYNTGYVGYNGNYLGSPLSNFSGPGGYSYAVSTLATFGTPGWLGQSLYNSIDPLGSYRYEHPASSPGTVVRSTPGPW